MSISVSDITQQLRERIQIPRTTNRLLENSADWYKLCSALDVISDTDLGLDAYLDPPRVNSFGLQYLYVYGVFQLLQTQQDAVIAICSTLNISTENSPKLPHICDLRSSSVAHPMSRTEKKAKKSGFIERISLDYQGFNLMTVFSDGRPYKFQAIHIPTLIDEQRGVLSSVLNEVVECLDEEIMAHKKQHQGERLSDIFPATLGYDFSKIHEAAHHQEFHPLGVIHINIVKDILTEFKQALEAREEWGARSGIENSYELLRYPIEMLIQYFSDSSATRLNEKDAYIFASFIAYEISNLIEMAEEIDKEYSSETAAQ